MKNVVLVCLIALCVLGNVAFADNTWLVTAGKTTDWYNVANWSYGTVPVAGDSVNLNDIGDPSHSVVIDGLGGTRAAAICGYFGWVGQAGSVGSSSASMLITDGATLNVNGTFYLATNPPGFCPCPCKDELDCKWR